MTRGDAIRVFVARPALLLLWALVLWGTLLLVVAGSDALGDGVRPVLHRLLPARGASLWAWLNAVSAVLAIVAWATFAAVLARRRRLADQGESA